MPVTPSGIYSLPVVYGENLLASSATFRTLVGAADADEAKAHIYYEQTIDREDEEQPGQIVCPRPRAILYPDEGDTARRFGVGEWQPTGVLIADLELVIPDVYFVEWNKQNTAEWKSTIKEQKLWLWNQLGAIRQELQDNSGGHDASGNSYLNAQPITGRIGPIPPRNNKAENWGFLRLEMGWV